MSNSYAIGVIEKALSVDEPAGIVEHIVSFEAEDRDGDIVRLDGLDLSLYRRNPIVLYLHGLDPKFGTLPIGTSLSLVADGPKLVAKTQFALDLPDPENRPRLIFEAYKVGLLRGWSIAFAVLEAEERKPSRPNALWPGRDVKRSELREYSAVPVPANPLALTEAVKSGMDLELVARSIGLFVPTVDQYQAVKNELDGFRRLEEKLAELARQLKTLQQGLDNTDPVSKNATVNEAAIPSPKPAAEPGRRFWRSR